MVFRQILRDAKQAHSPTGKVREFSASAFLVNSPADGPAASLPNPAPQLDTDIDPGSRAYRDDERGNWCRQEMITIQDLSGKHPTEVSRESIANQLVLRS